MTGPSRFAAVALAVVAGIFALTTSPAAAQPRPAPLAVVIVVEGTTAFMGNQSYARAQDCRAASPGTICRLIKVAPGAHAEVAAALGAGRRGLGARLGRGARAALIAYGDAAPVVVPMGPAAKLTGKRLGAQRAYADRSVRRLAAGLTAALAVIEATPADRRAVIVIGSGLASDGADLEAVKARYVAARVPVLYLQWNPSPALLAEEPDGAARLRTLLGGGDDGSSAVRLERSGDLAPALAAAIDRLRDGAAPASGR